MTSGWFDVKSIMFPSIIHSVITHNGNSFGETPNTGRMFGWERRLQITISWNKRCHGSSEPYVTRKVAAYLLDFEQILGCVGAECFYTYTSPTAAAFPDICEPSRSECDVAFP